MTKLCGLVPVLVTAPAPWADVFLEAAAAGLVAGGVIAAEALIIGGGVCAIGGAVGAISGDATQRKIEDFISEEAKERDPSFSEAHNKTGPEVAADVLLGAGAAAVGGGLAKGVRRAVVPKWQVGETALKYNIKKHMTEGCIKTAVTEGPKLLRQQPDSAAQVAEAGLGLVVNIGCGGLSAAAGDSAERALLKRAVAETSETFTFAAAQEAASAPLRVAAAAAKSAASTSVTATKGIVVKACKNQEVDLDQCLDCTLDVVAEAGAGAINGVVGPKAHEKGLFKDQPSLLKPAKKLTAATAQQVKGIVKGKAELDLASTVHKTLETTVVKLADVSEEVKGVGSRTLNAKVAAAAVSCAAAAHCANAAELCDQTSPALASASEEADLCAEAGESSVSDATTSEVTATAPVVEISSDALESTSEQVAESSPA